MTSPIHVGASDRDVSSDSLLSVQSNNPMMGETDVKSTTEEQQHQGTAETPNLELVNSPISQSSGLGQRSLLPSTRSYKTYKRRFFGLAQLVLLNIIVSWDWLSFSPVSKTSSQYFHVSEGAINWLSTGFLFAFIAATPATIWVLNRYGPRGAIIVTACFILVGNWIRYAGTRADQGHFGVVMFGQILIGFAQPFCLSAPTRYSDLWFSDKGRISATAVASLANPFGGALGQLIDPFWANKPSDIPNMTLYISIISSIASIPSFFIPSAPPTPPSASSHHTQSTIAGPTGPSLLASLRSLSHSLPFFLLTFPFWVYVGFFNAISSLLNQILEPHGYSETEAGIAGAILIIVGLVAAAIVSPIVDRYKPFLLVIKTCIPLVAICYLIFIWTPASGTIVASYIICAALGASCFVVVPVALEFLVEIMYPIGPEVGSTICWAGGQLLGGLFIVIMNSLKDKNGDMRRALIFQAIVALVVAPMPLFLGVRGAEVRWRRLEIERGAVAPFGEGREGEGGGEGSIPVQ